VIVYCEGGCGLGVDANVYPKELRRDGTYVCGTSAKCDTLALVKRAGNPMTADVYWTVVPDQPGITGSMEF
jgi:hypothetical protein